MQRELLVHLQLVPLQELLVALEQADQVALLVLAVQRELLVHLQLVPLQEQVELKDHQELQRQQERAESVVVHLQINLII